MDFNTGDFLMAIFGINFMLLYHFRSEEIKKRAFVDSDKEIINRYFNQLTFYYLAMFFIVVGLPYTFPEYNKFYIYYYIVITIILFVLARYFNKKYNALLRGSNIILAKQTSNFNIKQTENYKGQEFLSELQKKVLRLNNNFDFTIRKDDLTVQKTNLNPQKILMEFEIFEKKLRTKSVNPQKNIIYKKLVTYINKKLNYLNLDPLHFEDKNYSLLFVQYKIFKKIKELKKNNITLKYGQLYNTKSTYTFQFLNFLDCFKSGKFNNDSIFYALKFLKDGKYD